MMGLLLDEVTFKCHLEIQKNNTHAKKGQISVGIRWVMLDLLKEVKWRIVNKFGTAGQVRYVSEESRCQWEKNE